MLLGKMWGCTAVRPRKRAEESDTNSGFGNRSRQRVGWVDPVYVVRGHPEFPDRRRGAHVTSVPVLERRPGLKAGANPRGPALSRFGNQPHLFQGLRLGTTGAGGNSPDPARLEST